MHDFARRTAIGGLLVTGLLTALSPWLVPAHPVVPADALWPMLLQGQLLVVVLGAGLLLASFLPQLRLAMVGAAIVSKAGFLAATLPQRSLAAPVQAFEAALLVLLLAAAAVLSLQALQQARWDGVLPLRTET
jgi:hypothetical protein